jgi:hypothetical protein
MAYVRTDGEKTVEALARRVYGVEADSPEGRAAETALRKANPELRRIDKLPPETVIEVPTLDLPEPTTPVLEFPELAGSVAVEGARADLADLHEALDGLVEARVDDAVRTQRRLKAKTVEKAARADESLASYVEDVADELQDEADEARALRAEQKQALAQLSEDLHELASIFSHA